MEKQQMSYDEIIRAIDALNRVASSYVNSNKNAEGIYKKIEYLIAKL